MITIRKLTRRLNLNHRKSWTAPRLSEQTAMPDDLPLDAQWEEIYTAGTPSGTGNDYGDDELPLYQGETTETLQDYLIWQAA